MDYTRTDLEKRRKWGDVTSNGVVFDWWLRSSAGAGFCLLREPQQTDADIAEAKRLLNNSRDVVGTISVVKIKD